MKTFDTYQDARRSFVNGDIVFFSKGKQTLLRRITKFFTGKTVHVGIAFWMTCDEAAPRLMIAESQPGGYRIVNLGYAKSDDMVVFRCPVPWFNIVDVVMASTGVIPYSYLDLVRIALHEKFGFPACRGGGRSLVCSEIVVKILLEAGFDAGNVLVSPQRLFERIVASREPAFSVAHK